MCVEQVLGILGGHYRDADYPVAPRFMWVNFTLTDAAMHEGGPHSEMARGIGARQRRSHRRGARRGCRPAGIFDDSAFVLVADHGMEETDPTCRGDWDVPLREAGLQFRDEGYGFLYFGVD